MDKNDTNFIEKNIGSPNPFTLQNEILKLQKSKEPVASIYDTFYQSEGGFWIILQAQKRLLDLVTNSIKSQGHLNADNQFEFSDKSFARYSYDTRKTAEMTFNSNINTNFQAFSSLKD
jgi:hypothetical protein